jgi:hypothetical protein
MLGKLMKYELKATARIYLPLFAALLIVAAANRMFIAMNFTVPKIIGTTISVVMIVAICVIALILTLQRFYRNLLKSEGYLMFTLPVSTDSIIWSKLFVAGIWTVASFIAVLLAVSIMAMTGLTFHQIMVAIGDFFQAVRDQGFNVILCAVEAIILVLVSLMSGILLLYTCMSLSLLVGKYRVGFAFLMYIAISIIGQTIMGILATTVSFTNLCRIFEDMSGFGQIQTAFGALLLCTAIPGVIFYFVTRFMLKNKLNLE